MWGLSTAEKEVAVAANARETDRGREERRKREELLKSAPLDSPVHAHATPMYVLDPRACRCLPVLNPRWRKPAATAAQQATTVAAEAAAAAAPAALPAPTP